jgi:hypothetical protein
VRLDESSLADPDMTAPDKTFMALMYGSNVPWAEDSCLGCAGYPGDSRGAGRP